MDDLHSMFQMACIANAFRLLALFDRWGGYCLWKWPEEFTYRGFLISMFSLVFSLSGLGMAA